MTPKNCIECEYSKTCTDAYYGGTTCKHYYDMIEAIFDKSRSDDRCKPHSNFLEVGPRGKKMIP